MDDQGYMVAFRRCLLYDEMKNLDLRRRIRQSRLFVNLSATSLFFPFSDKNSLNLENFFDYLYNGSQTLSSLEYDFYPYLYCHTILLFPAASSQSR
jgi:hypothetical protein